MGTLVANDKLQWVDVNLLENRFGHALLNGDFPATVHAQSALI